MGMFDTINLDKAIACKTCGADIVDFRTKEFDSCMNHYRIGSVLSGCQVLSGVIKDQAYCKADARLASVDRLDLLQWIAEAQKKEQQWRRRFYSLHNELSKWHDYVEEQKKPQEPESEGNKTWRTLSLIWKPSDEITTAADPIEKILELHTPKKNEEAPGFF
jgi:hypothetical protein